MKLIILLPFLLLGGCGGKNIIPDAPKVVTVKVPVQTDCLGHLPNKPNFLTDKELYNLPTTEFIYALNLDRIERDGYMALLEASIEGCK